MRFDRSLTWGVAVMAFASCAQSEGTERQFVNVYSTRHYGAMEPMYEEFTKETGIEVRLSHGSMSALLERMRNEGDQTVADVFFAVDAGGLWLAAEEGLLQSVNSETLRANIPAPLRDGEDRFFGLSQRVRSIAYNPAKVNTDELSTYAALGDPKWKGRLCLRPATNVYTQSLVANLVADHGEEGAERIVEGWVTNKPEYIDSDTRILETIAAGGCDVGITNHYYLARLLSRDAAFPVKMFWADQNGAGAHRNVSGVGVTAAAGNRDNAIRLIEWLSGPGQSGDENGLPGSNFEFPVKADVTPHTILQQFGDFRVDTLPLADFGRRQADAIKLLERTGYR